MDMQLFLSIALWLMIGSATAYFANQRGRDPWIWFMIGMLLGLIGLLILFLLPAAKSENSPSSSEEIEFPIVELDPPLPLPPVTFNNDSEWYYYNHKQEQQGPITYENLKSLWQAGEINEETYMWCEGMKDWKKLEELQDLYAKLLLKN
jgi:hypothetical protein